ncbi:MAG: DUF6599 family protein [Pseudomonadota bacterium]
MTRPDLIILIWLCVFLCAPGTGISETSGLKSLVPARTSEGWAVTGPPGVFTKETLFEHINGQADLFLHYGFKESVFAAYRKAPGNETVDVDIYDMGDAGNAFGVFSRFRQDHRPAGIGLDSYLDDDYALFYKGKYFVVLQGTESNSSGLKQLARSIESRIVDGSPPPREPGYFPKRGLEPGSIEYYPQGLMGRQFLGKGFKATYRLPEKKAPNEKTPTEGPDSNMFIAVFDNDREAESALKSFEEVLSQGKISPPANRTVDGLNVTTGEDPYQGMLMIVRKGRYVAGTTGFGQEHVAGSLLADLVKQMD